MAPGITDFAEDKQEIYIFAGGVAAARASKLDALKAYNQGGRHDGQWDEEQPSQRLVPDQADMAISSTTTTTTAAAVAVDTEHNESVPAFKMPSMHKLREAQRRAEHDFRSDTVTVPTAHMMQVSSLLIEPSPLRYRRGGLES